MSSKAVSLLLSALCKRDGLQVGEMYYHNGAEKVVENKSMKTSWDFSVTIPEI